MLTMYKGILLNSAVGAGHARPAGLPVNVCLRTAAGRI